MSQIIEKLKFIIKKTYISFTLAIKLYLILELILKKSIKFQSY